ncbi:hypothetical protein EVAR_28500_1 [Eumeta japonica]|uniref:Uncharacterized protein n=1 Tax=Eumeta variegata TaxID=151549 RepID=A0A4C1WP50_EUMVA|nr:hypothetical protein EVAR_28500_1 [Eumeta japonica]
MFGSKYKENFRKEFALRENFGNDGESRIIDEVITNGARHAPAHAGRARVRGISSRFEFGQPPKGLTNNRGIKIIDHLKNEPL